MTPKYKILFEIYVVCFGRLANCENKIVPQFGDIYFFKQPSSTRSCSSSCSCGGNSARCSWSTNSSKIARFRRMIMRQGDFVTGGFQPYVVSCKQRPSFSYRGVPQTRLSLKRFPGQIWQSSS